MTLEGQIMGVVFGAFALFLLCFFILKLPRSGETKADDEYEGGAE